MSQGMLVCHPPRLPASWIMHLSFPTNPCVLDFGAISNGAWVQFWLQLVMGSSGLGLNNFSSLAYFWSDTAPSTCYYILLLMVTTLPLPEFTQTHVHWVGDAIQPSNPLSSPFPPSFNLSQHQGLFKWVIRWPAYWSFSFNISPSNEYSGLISFRMDWLNFLAVQGTLKRVFSNTTAVSYFFLSLQISPSPILFGLQHTLKIGITLKSGV